MQSTAIVIMGQAPKKKGTSNSGGGPKTTKARCYRICSFGLCMKNLDQASEVVFNTLLPR
jgi:hypothetical protein